MNRERLAGVGILGAIVAFNVAFFHGLWDGTMAFWFRDAIIGYLPTKLYLRERILSGEWPLWTERVKGGMPFWADPVNGILYPGHIPLFVLNSPLHAYGILVAIHFLFAHAGFYVLLRTFARSRPAALLGSFCIVYGGIFIQKHENLQFLFAWSWLGWYLSALYRFSRHPGWGNGALVIGSLFAILTSGDIQTAYVLSSLSLVIAAAGQKSVQHALARAGQTAWLLVTTGLLTAPFLLPVYELSTRTTRTADNSLKSAMDWSFHPFRWIEWFVPGPFGFTFSEQTPFWARGITRSIYSGFYTPQSYFGILLIPLALWAIMRVHSKTVRFWSAVGLAAFSLACGEWLPFYEYLYRWLPLWGNFRFPERLLIWLVIAIGILAAHGFDSLQNDRDRPFRHWPAVKMALVATALWIASRSLSSLAPWMNGIRGAPAEPAAYEQFSQALSRGAGFWLIGALAIAAFSSTRSRIVSYTLVTLTALELWSVNRPQAPVWPSSNYRTPPSLVSTLVRDFPEEMSPEGLPAKLFFNHERGRIHWAGDETQGVSKQIWNLVYGNLILLTPFSTPVGYNSSELTSMVKMLRSTHWSNFAALTDINYWLVLPETAKRRTDWNCGSKDPGTGLVWCRDSTPKQPVRCPSTWTRIDDPEQLAIAYRITDWKARRDFALLGTFDTRDLSNLPPSIQSGSGTSARTCAQSGWDDDRRIIRIDRDTEGPVILRDIYYPGWKAVSEGRELPVIVANGGQLAVWSPSGSHEIELVFEPESLQTGILLALFGFVFNWGLAWWKWRTSERPLDFRNLRP